MSIIYGLIAQNNKPLCDYSEYKGTFTSICIRTLPKCSNERGLLTIQNAYNIFYRNENGITFLYLCENSFPQEAAIVCLDKTIEEFFKNFSTQTDYSNEPQYCLNNQFQRKLFEKMQKYNSNSNILDENINELKENLLSMNKQVQLIVNKAEKLSQDSHNFADTTKRVKRLEKWRKIKMYIIIGGIILALILLIYIFSKI